MDVDPAHAALTWWAWACASVYLAHAVVAARKISWVIAKCDRSGSPIRSGGQAICYLFVGLILLPLWPGLGLGYMIESRISGSSLSGLLVPPRTVRRELELLPARSGSTSSNAIWSRPTAASAEAQRWTRDRSARSIRARKIGAAKRTSSRSAVPQAVKPPVGGDRKVTE